MANGSFIKVKNKVIQGSARFFEETFLQKKLNNWFGILFVAAVAVLFGYLLATDLVIGLSLFGGLLGLFVAIICLSNAEAGLYITTIYSFFAYFISRFLFAGTMSTGIFFDVLVLATFLGLFVQGTDFKENFVKFTRTPLVIVVLLTLFFSAIEIFNPNSMSLDTNILAFRKFLGYVLLMFISYTVFDSYEKVRRFIIFLFFVITTSAIYGCIQQWHGYFNFEMQLILSDPHGFGLIFINGEFRKYSTMSDPAAFGIIMAAGAVFYLILATQEKDLLYKRLFIAGSIFMVLGMGYSGTRTANAIIVAGLVFFLLLNFDKKSTRIFGLIATLIFLFVLYGPIHGNKTIDRFRTTFVGEEDMSYKVRVLSRKFVQPYILTHPIGGGLGSTGATGVATQPGHYLANFQPDSSYLKRAAETGYIGLAITCILYFIALLTGIKGFFRSGNGEIKIIYAACVTALFAFYIAEYAQEALGQITDVVVYYPILAIILKLKEYDTGGSHEINGEYRAGKNHEPQT
jgi:O-antigen ligase/polysaccharide polymerase Wzy-like membrane protein